MVNGIDKSPPPNNDSSDSISCDSKSVNDRNKLICLRRGQCVCVFALPIQRSSLVAPTSTPTHKGNRAIMKLEISRMESIM